MFTAKIQNANGEILTLTGNQPNYQVVSITGLNPPKAQINTTNIAGLDGTRFNSSKLNNRNIVITLRIVNNVESNRLMLYRYFRTKESCTFYFTNDTLEVSIDGYVDTVECNLFTRGETMQISIICPYPYFSGLLENVTDISNQTGAFHFPFSINIGEPVPFSVYYTNRVTNVQNNSQAETGAVIYCDLSEAINTLRIVNTNTGEYILLQYAFQAGDRIIIDTNKGRKSVTLIRNTIASNIFTAVQLGSTFFQLAVGENEFGYQANNGAADSFVSISFHFRNLYRGV